MSPVVYNFIKLTKFLFAEKMLCVRHCARSRKHPKISRTASDLHKPHRVQQLQAYRKMRIFVKDKSYKYGYIYSFLKNVYIYINLQANNY